MDIKELVVEIATAVIKSQIGDGEWTPESEPYKAPSKAMQGLNVGDFVWHYEENDCELKKEMVVLVKNGVGYVFDWAWDTGPCLTAVSENTHAKTPGDAIALWSEQIEADTEYHTERAERLKDIAALRVVSQIEAPPGCFNSQKEAEEFLERFNNHQAELERP